MLKYLNSERDSSDTMKILHFSCANCNSENVIYKRDKELVFQVGNPKIIRFRADCYECQDCGETYLDEEAMKKSAKTIDRQEKSNASIEAARDLAAKSVPADYDSVKSTREEKKKRAKIGTYNEFLK